MSDDREREEQITDLSMQRSRTGREDRADFLEEERSGRVEALDVLRERRARELAFEEGRHRERIDQRLSDHEVRLNRINGSIERSATALRALTEKIDVKNAVDVALRDAIKEANANSLNARSFKMWMGGTMVMLLGVFVTLLAALHVL